MDVVKLSTAGSVDDGKSTLIGRLLYDSKSLKVDQLNAIEEKSKQKGFDYLDFSLATDGLLAEREQGITIDVAHIYFQTEKRKFIIADTPGHVEYTRNMVTGASTSEASMILVDARNGIVEQTYRHFFITQLLGIKKVIITINKIDLVDYNEAVFQKIKQEFEQLLEENRIKEVELHFIPISALKGDNISELSPHTPWFKGEPLLETLEKIDVYNNQVQKGACFSVQYVIRPHSEEFHDYRGYAGKIISGELKKGQTVTVYPQGRSSKIKNIHRFDMNRDEAYKGESVSIELEDDIDVSRGSLIVSENYNIQVGKLINSSICWMSESELVIGKKYLLQHGSRQCLVKLKRIKSVLNPVNPGEKIESEKIGFNEIGVAEWQSANEMFYTYFKDNKNNGSFIIVDQMTNQTVGVGMIIKEDIKQTAEVFQGAYI